MFKLYDDVIIKPAASGVIISLPWMEGTVEIVQQTSDSELFQRDFRDQLEIRDCFNAETLIKFPFCYLLPRKLKTVSVPAVVSGIASDAYLTPVSLLNTLADYHRETIGNADEFIPQKWNWDIQQVKELAAIDSDSYDPLSVYSYIRERRHLDDVTAAKEYREQLDYLLTHDENRFFEAIGTSLVQGLYVTENCTGCLRPALETFKEAYYEVKSFINEEEGHDQYVLETLNELPVNWKKLPLFNETRFLMLVLKHTAKYHPLAFSCIVSQFEEPGYQPYDPTAEILIRSSRPEAAKGVQKHFDINKLGNHAETGAEFALNLQAIELNELNMAMRFTELSKRLLIGIETRLYEASLR